LSYYNYEKTAAYSGKTLLEILGIKKEIKNSINRTPKRIFHPVTTKFPDSFARKRKPGLHSFVCENK